MCKRRRDQRGGRQGKFGSTQALATEMASYGPVSLEAGGGRAISQDDSEVSLRLADALRKMDGLIGDYRFAAAAAAPLSAENCSAAPLSAESCSAAQLSERLSNLIIC